MFKNKRKSNSFLYTGIKNRAENMPDTQEIQHKKASIKRKLVVSTVSLKGGVGSSYTGMAVANFLSNAGKEKTCFLHSGCGYVEDILDGDVDSIYYPCNMSEVYSNYSYIVYDAGTIKEADMGLLERSDIKLMLCWFNDEYIRQLASFIKTRNDINNWVFIFNHVPDKNQNKVYALMEDYSSCCIPVFDASHLDKGVKLLFSKIFFYK